MQDTTTRARVFVWAAAMGIASVLPLVGLTIWGVASTLQVMRPHYLVDLFLFLGVGAFGVVPVIATALRMVRRPDKPVALFVLALVVAMLPTLATLTLAAVGRGGAEFLTFGLGALTNTVAAVLAIVGAIQQRFAARRSA